MKCQKLISGHMVSVARFLSEHPDEFFVGRDLCVKFGFPLGADRRAFRLAMARLAEEGLPIIASSRGYAWARSQWFVICYQRMLLNKIKGLHDRLELVQKIKVKA